MISSCDSYSSNSVEETTDKKRCPTPGTREEIYGCHDEKSSMHDEDKSYTSPVITRNCFHVQKYTTLASVLNKKGLLRGENRGEIIPTQ